MGRRSKDSAHRQRERLGTQGGIFPALFLVALIGSITVGAFHTPAETTAAPPSPARSAVLPPETSRPSSSPPTVDVPPATTPAAASVEPTDPVSSEPGSSQPAAAPPVRLAIDAADIDVAILQLTPSEEERATQSIVPPFTDDGYWLSSYGTPGDGSTNTTYIAGHSWEGREAPFNRLSTLAAPGDTITLDTITGTLTYVIDTITTHDKETLKTSDIWDVIPNQLVIISCYTEDLWGKNVVITASPA